MKQTKPKPKKQPRADAFTRLVQSTLGVQCVAEHRFHPVRLWRFDYAIPAYKIALEVEGGIWTGGRHTRAKGFLGDIEKYNTATLQGWRVLRTTPTDLYSAKTLQMLKIAVLGYFEPEKQQKTPENNIFLPEKCV